MKRSLILIFSVSFFVSCNKRAREVVKTEYKDSLVYVTDVRVDSVDREVVKVVTQPVAIHTQIPCEEGKKTSSSFKAGKANVNIKPNDVGGYDVAVDVESDTCTYEKEYRLLQSRYDSIVNIKSDVQEVTTDTIREKKGFLAIVKERFLEVLLIILLILWLFGITPKFIFSTILKIVTK